MNLYGGGAIAFISCGKSDKSPDTKFCGCLDIILGGL